jgi:DNA-directed RNA polymerase subunit RPC12/RpoP
VSKKTIYHRGYVIEWIEHMNSWRIYREESKANTIAYEDDPEEAVRRLDEEEPDLYCGSEDGMEVEYCNVCGNEIELRWDINRDGFQAHCPVCGSRLMLCDACNHRHGEPCDDCDFGIWKDKELCRFRRPDDWWKEEGSL